MIKHSLEFYIVLLHSSSIPECMKWTLPSLNLDMSIAVNGFQSKLKNRMANSEDPDEMAGTAVNRGFSLNSKTEWQMCTLSVGLALSKLILPPVYLVIS